MPKINVDASKCPQDHDCPLAEMCPTGAITQEGNVPIIDDEKCIACGLCVASCTHGALSFE